MITKKLLIVSLVVSLIFLSGKPMISSTFAEPISPFQFALHPELADEGTKILFSIVCHVEPFQGGRSPDYRNESYFRAQLKSLEKFTAMLEKHGAKLTLQVQKPFTDSLAKWSNPLPAMELKGHEIATHFHEDVWVKSTEPREKRKQALSEMKKSVDTLGVTNQTLCGGWMWEDLPEVAFELGFKYLDNYKNPKTQKGLIENLTVFPYRLKESALYITEGCWTDSKKLASLPAKAKPQDFDKVTLMLNYSFPDLVFGKVCTANVVMHLSDFSPGNDTALINLYDDYLTKILDPIAKTGLLEYSTIRESGKQFEEIFR